MKEVSEIKKILQRRGKIENTTLNVMLLTDNDIEIRIRYEYSPNPKAKIRDSLRNIYDIFDKCRRVISGDANENS